MEAAWIYGIEIIGTIAFAWSGAMVGIRKNLDVFGVIVLGMVTAVGGGAVRDVLLGLMPPGMFRNPSYAVVAFVTSLLLFLLVYWKQKILESKYMAAYEKMMNLCDALGLGIFVVVGVHAGYAQGQSSLFFLVFLGVITGIGGGMLRDVMAGEMPFVLYKRVYAVAALAGAVACAALIPYGVYLAALVGAGITVVIRLLAIRYRWNLPKAVHEDKKRRDGGKEPAGNE